MNPKPLKKMKTIQKIWGLLPMTVAALMLTACSSDDQTTTTPNTPDNTSVQAQTIHYTVSVDQGEASTRAAVDEDMKTLKFAAGDKLYVTGTNIQGVLDIDDGDGTTTGPGTDSATFTGDLTYTGEGTPADDLELTATLVSALQSASLTTENKLVTVSEAGAVTVNYPTTAFCDDVATAVQKYSNLTGTSAYSERAFILQQKTAFLNFSLTMNDGTATATDITATVKNGETTLSTATVKTATVSEKVMANFVLPVAASTVLSGAKLIIAGSHTPAVKDIDGAEPITLSGKVYNVKRDELTLGDLFYSDGSVSTTLVTGKTPVAMIAYVGSDNGESSPYNHGLALALTDANNGNTCKWSTSTSSTVNTTQQSTITFTSESGLQYNATHNNDTYPAFKAAIANNGTAKPTTGSSDWFLASGYQWAKMFTAAGGVANLKTSAAPYIGLQSSRYYWSSSERLAGNAWRFYSGSDLWDDVSKDGVSFVRSCLAF